MKETFYFSHDYNAAKDPKCSALLAEHGYSGYGLYWAIIELLHQQAGGKLKKFPGLTKGLAYQFRIDEALLEANLSTMFLIGLLSQDENYIWSDRVSRNLREREAKWTAKKEAGRLGGQKSGEVRRGKSKQNEAPLEPNELKESKVKESKVNKRERESEETSPTPAEETKEFFEMISEKGEKYQELVQSLSFQKVLPQEKCSAELDKFVGYWSELTKDGKRQRWQLEKTFEVKRRVANWFQNITKFSSSGFGSKASQPKSITIIS